MRPHGRARVSTRSPQAFGICDRCGFLLNHASLQWQYDWRGASIQNTRMLVCSTCLDKPQQQLRALVVPADPVPIQNPRTQNYVAASTDYRTTQGNSVDPLTGLPIIGGATIISNVDTVDGAILLEGSDGFFLSEDGQSVLCQEQNSTLVGTFSRVTQQTGEPPGGINETPGTDPSAPGNSSPGLPYENIITPETGPL